MELKVTGVEGPIDGLMNVAISMTINMHEPDAVRSLAELLCLLLPEGERAEYLRQFRDKAMAAI